MRRLLQGMILAMAVAAYSALGDANDWSRENGQGAYARREGQFVRVGNAQLERVYRLNSDTLSTIQYINKRSGRAPGSQQGAEFAIAVRGAVNGDFSAPDFTFTDIVVNDKADPLEVVFKLTQRETPSLTVEVHVETSGKSYVQKKWIVIRWDGEGDLTVDRIDVESTGGFGWWFEANPVHEGMGQPLFVSDMYFGLEYPGGDITNEFLRHYPGRSAKRGLRSKTAIWGVADSAAHVRDSFLTEYLSAFVPAQTKPFVIWNLIGTGTPESSMLVREIQSTAVRTTQSNLKIDSYAIDDVWQDYTSVWKPDPIRFPRGLTQVAQAAEAVSSRLGLWLTLDGMSLDTRWGKARGLEVTQTGYRGPTGGRYCIAGPQYKSELKRALELYVRDNKVNYFKIDYNAFGCEDTSHGHGAGPAGREAQIDAFVDVLDGIKAIAPDCRIALTTGAWLSPWWLPHADYVWLGGNDMGEMKDLRNLTPQDSAMTYRDAVLYDDFVEKQYAFPFEHLMTHGFWEVGGATYDKFQDDVVMTVGRGIAKYEILNAPSALDDKRFRFLARAIKWGVANWDILQRTRLFLGDPRKGEIYGFAHVGDSSTMLFLRNPDVESKTATFTTSDAGIGADFVPLKYGKLKAYELYPSESELDWDGDVTTPIALNILGSQTKVVAIAGSSMPDRLRLK